MGFSKRLMRGRTLLGALVGGGLWAVPAIAGAWTFDTTLGVWRDQAAPAATSSSAIEAKPRAQLAQAKTKAPLPTPMVERSPTNVEIVNKALNPGASDPNVPLPQAGLSDGAGNEPQASNAPRIFGRGEDGGGVLGLRVPIPADRNASGATARYGSGQASSESGPETRGR
jgi:hypothetical protein